MMNDRPQQMEPAESVAANLESQARSLADEIEAIRIEAEPDGYMGITTDLKKKAISSLRTVAWAWPISLQKTPVKQVDRRLNILGGPIFTSRRFPWPEDECENALEPVLQIDLELCRGKGPKEVGEGVLQVWGSANDKDVYTIRTIPKHVVQNDLLDEMPGSLSDSVHIKYGAFSDWLNFPNLDAYSWQIQKVNEKVLTWSEHLRFDLEGFRDADDFRHEEADFEFLSSSRKDLVRSFIDAKEMIDRFLASLPTGSPRPEPHLFGCFREIQYAAREKPRCLLSLDSDELVGFGDLGSAQVFFSSDSEGAVEFSFDWSCG